MNYVEQKTGPMCSVGTMNGEYTLRMLIGGSKETFVKLSKEEYDEFPRWTGSTYDSIQERLFKACK